MLSVFSVNRSLIVCLASFPGPTLWSLHAEYLWNIVKLGVHVACVCMGLLCALRQSSSPIIVPYDRISLPCISTNALNLYPYVSGLSILYVITVTTDPVFMSCSQIMTSRLCFSIRCLCTPPIMICLSVQCNVLLYTTTSATGFENWTEIWGGYSYSLHK